MAYTPASLTRLSGGSGFTFWHYSTADTIADVNTAGYFNSSANLISVVDSSKNVIVMNRNTDIIVYIHLQDYLLILTYNNTYNNTILYLYYTYLYKLYK